LKSAQFVQKSIFEKEHANLLNINKIHALLLSSKIVRRSFFVLWPQRDL